MEISSGSIMDNKDAVVALAALAQESRLATFRLLVQAGPGGLAASKIAEALGMPPSSLSFHLKELSNANLIVPRQEGRFVIYAAQFDAMNALLGFLTENCCGGNPCSPTGSPACAPRTSTCGA
jgi:DNA-binding transcriptional ArsR family regulator